MNYYLEEKKLSEKLCDLISGEFLITNEAEIMKNPGKFSHDGEERKQIPDLIIRPKKPLIETGKFIDTFIPIELKKFAKLECNKFEDLMFQCHSYRMSTFNGLYPKLCLYFIDNYFEYRKGNDHLSYEYEASKNPRSNDHMIRSYIKDKMKIETIFGRFGIGELVTNGSDYCFRVKRQVLFEKKDNKLIYKPNILNYWWGTKNARKNHL